MNLAEAARAAPAALVTVLATEGSAPRGPGARMLVRSRETIGTIGGGALELRATEQARALLGHPPGSWRVQDWPLGPLLGQCCGGRVRLLVEHLAPETGWLTAIRDGTDIVATLAPSVIARAPAPAGFFPGALDARGPLLGVGDMFAEPKDGARLPLTLFGAGHVGRAIARASTGLPVHLAWFDIRPEADAPGVTIDAADALVACAVAVAPDSAILILTHDHALDYRLTAAALAGQARFVGLIGSRTKRQRFLARLARDGIDAARLTCPIGLPGITGKEPEVIAIAAVAQLLTLRGPG